MLAQLSSELKGDINPIIRCAMVFIGLLIPDKGMFETSLIDFQMS